MTTNRFGTTTHYDALQGGLGHLKSAIGPTPTSPARQPKHTRQTQPFPHVKGHVMGNVMGHDMGHVMYML